MKSQCRAIGQARVSILVIFSFVIQICFLCAMSANAWSQDFGGLLREIIKGVQKEAGPSKTAADKQKSALEVSNDDFEKALRCDPRVTMWWPPTIEFANVMCSSPEMSFDEQQRLKSVLISYYKWDDPKNRGREDAFEKDKQTIGERVKYPDFYECLEEIKRLPAIMSNKELEENPNWKNECGQHKKSGYSREVANKVKKRKLEEIEEYRRQTWPQKIYAECISYIDSIEPTLENKPKLVTFNTTDLNKAEFLSYCNESSNAKYPPSQAQYAEISAKRKAKLAEMENVIAAQYARKLADALRRHKADIEKLGIPTSWLTADIIISGKKFFTLGEWIAFSMDNKKIKSFGTIRVKGNYGVTVKIPQQQTEGFVFKMDGNELYPSHYVAGDEAIPIRTEGDLLTVALRMAKIKNEQ